MIENISTEFLYDSEYIEIMNKIEELRQKEIKHEFKLNKLGTNNGIYSIFATILSIFEKNKKLKQYSRGIKRRLIDHFKSRKKILESIQNVVWTSDVIKSSTLAYPVRRVEYPWSYLNSKMDDKMRILDIGSGISLFPVFLASKGHQVTSIDYDEVLMNRIAPKLAQWADMKVDYRVGDATKLDFPDNTFDRIFCISVLEHLEEKVVNGKIINEHKENLDVKSIEEMLRVVKPGGLIILTFDWDEDKKNLRSYRLDDIYDRVLKPYTEFLINNDKPIINWDKLKEKHIASWKAFPPYDYIIEGWAVGVVLKK